MKVYELLGSEDKWTKQAYARDIDCKTVSPLSVKACRWCIVGAILKCYPEEQSFIHEKLNEYLSKTCRKYIIEWNDNSVYEEIIRVVKELDI